MNKNDYTIRMEKQEDYRETENLVREAFWNVYRPGCSEHYVIHVLRDDPAFVKELDFVMEQNGRLIGQNMFMKTVIEADDGRDISVLTMGPIGITPPLKRKGYGKILLDYSLEKAAELGFGAVLFEGNIRFYGKSGFDYASRFGIILSLQGTDPRISGWHNRRLSDAAGLLCGRRGRRGIRQGVPAQGKTEAAGTVV